MEDDGTAQQLRDERSLRLAAEQRAASLLEREQLWRRRAEERAERIERLERERELPLVRRAARALRRGFDDSHPPATKSGSDDVRAGISRPDAHTWRAYPSTRIVSITVSPEAVAVSEQFLELDPEDEGSWHEADLVLVEAAAFARLDADVRDAAVDALGARDAVPVLELLDPEGRRSPLPAAMVGSFGAPVSATGGDLHVLPRPVVASTTTGSGLVEVGGVDWSDPSAAELAAAAAGRLVRSGADPDRSAAAARRLAHRLHGPQVSAAAVLDLAGVAATRRPDRVGAVLVTNRPEAVVGALRNLLRTRQVDLEVVVGLHGFAASDELREVADRAEVPCLVLELDVDLPLGACLNQAIDHCSAPVIAKIDDDDHYGPAYLEDALRALRTTGASLVGKAAQFTYLEDRDETVVRRADVAEQHISGTPNGGTWVWQRGWWERVPFPHRPRRVDELCLDAMRRAGAEVYVNGPWEFSFTRGAGGHTWVTDDATILAGSRPAWSGRHVERVELDAEEIWS